MRGANTERTNRLSRVQFAEEVLQKDVLPHVGLTVGSAVALLRCCCCCCCYYRCCHCHCRCALLITHTPR
jgi:hypothetical protein